MHTQMHTQMLTYVCAYAKRASKRGHAFVYTYKCDTIHSLIDHWEGQPVATSTLCGGGSSAGGGGGEELHKVKGAAMVNKIHVDKVVTGDQAQIETQVKKSQVKSCASPQRKKQTPFVHTEPFPWSQVVTALVDMFEGPLGATRYDGAVTQVEHALQAAALAAEEAGSDSPEVLAALLHDVGHLLLDEHAGNDAFLKEDLCHEDVSANWLESQGFPSQVVEPIRLHVVTLTLTMTIARLTWESSFKTKSQT